MIAVIRVLWVFFPTDVTDVNGLVVSQLIEMKNGLRHVSHCMFLPKDTQTTHPCV